MRSCGACAQRFLSLFTETIDWTEGEYPQAWTVMPITPAEAAALTDRAAAVTEASLGTLGRDLRTLRHEYPKDQPRRTFWGRGFVVGPHD